MDDENNDYKPERFITAVNTILHRKKMTTEIFSSKCGIEISTIRGILKGREDYISPPHRSRILKSLDCSNYAQLYTRAEQGEDVWMELRQSKDVINPKLASLISSSNHDFDSNRFREAFLPLFLLSGLERPELDKQAELFYGDTTNILDKGASVTLLSAQRIVKAMGFKDLKSFEAAGKKAATRMVYDASTFSADYAKLSQADPSRTEHLQEFFHHGVRNQRLYNALKHGEPLNIFDAYKVVTALEFDDFAAFSDHVKSIAPKQIDPEVKAGVQSIMGSLTNLTMLHSTSIKDLHALERQGRITPPHNELKK